MLLRWAGIAFLGLKAFNFLYNQVYNNIEWEILKYQKGDLNLFQERLNLRIRVKNNNNVPIPVERFTCSLVFEEQIVGTVTNVQPLVFKAKEEKTVIIEMGISQEFYNKLSDLLTQQASVLSPVEVQGTIYIKGNALPFSSTYRLFGS